MIEEMIFFQSFGYVGGPFGNFLAILEQNGVFTYLLPFLIVFSIVFGILTKINIFSTQSKVLNSIISIAVALMAMQSQYVSGFFSGIFPQMAVWLSVILVVIIVWGIVSPNKQFNKGFMLIMGTIILVLIFTQSFGIDSWSGWASLPYWWVQYWPTIIIIAVALAAVAAIISNTPNKQPFKFGTFLDNFFQSVPYNTSKNP